jgi:hypothetical protein
MSITRWERYGDGWIRDRFVSKHKNIFITEITETGLRVYWFDDGPEIPTDSIELNKAEAAELETQIVKLREKGGQAVCEYLADFFPDLKQFWLDKYGGI